MRKNSIVIPLTVLALGLILGGQFSPSQGAAPVVKTPSPVEVVNFPQIQEVTGQVSVGNLPLDTAGNLRVSMQSGPSSYLFVQVADAVPIGVAQADGIGHYEVAGWKNVQVFFRPNFGAESTCLELFPQFGQGAMFGAAPWTGIGICSNSGQIAAPIAGGPVLGPEIRFLVGGSALSSTTLDVWLYLTN